MGDNFAKINEWKMLTLVGEDQPGIVAAVTEKLYQHGWTLGEASMIRLGASFTIMMMISGEGDVQALLSPVAERLRLHLHIDEMTGGLHRHIAPNIQVRVVGADRTGIVAQVTGALAKTGFNVLELESDVAGTEFNPVYIMNIQGYSETTLEQLEQAVSGLSDIDVTISSIETLIG